MIAYNKTESLTDLSLVLQLVYKINLLPFYLYKTTERKRKVCVSVCVTGHGRGCVAEDRFEKSKNYIKSGDCSF